MFLAVASLTPIVNVDILIVTNFPLLGIGFAIPLLWFIVFLLSWGGTFIMLKVPGINSLL